MTRHKVGTRKEWLAPRNGLLERENAHAQRTFDIGFAFTGEQMAGIEEVQQMIKQPPDWLQEWAEAVGTDLQTGLAEGPGWMAFALEDGGVYHTYSRLVPDRDFVVPYYHQLLDRTPKGWVDEFRAFRRDEYENAAARS